MEKENLEDKKAKLEKELEEINKQLQDKEKEERAKQEKDKNKLVFTYIEELNLEISQLAYKDMSYPEILKIVKEEDIATHEELFSLRKLVDKYPQFKSFWAFVPNPDDVAKKNCYVAWFDAGSDGAGFVCSRYPSGSGASLGVFVVKRKVQK